MEEVIKFFIQNINMLILIVTTYIITSLINMFRTSREDYVFFEWNPTEDRYKNLIVHDDGLENIDGIDILLIRNDTVLFNIKEIDLIYEKGKIKRDKSKRGYPLLDIMSPKECFLYRACLSEGPPGKAIEVENSKYMKACLFLQYNGREGNRCESVRYRYTIRSFLYMLGLVHINRS